LAKKSGRCGDCTDGGRKKSGQTRPRSRHLWSKIRNVGGRKKKNLQTTLNSGGYGGESIKSGVCEERKRVDSENNWGETAPDPKEEGRDKNSVPGYCVGYRTANTCRAHWEGKEGGGTGVWGVGKY